MASAACMGMMPVGGFSPRIGDGGGLQGSHAPHWQATEAGRERVVVTVIRHAQGALKGDRELDANQVSKGVAFGVNKKALGDEGAERFFQLG